MKNCPSLNRGFQEKCNNCGVIGHKAAQCPKNINEVVDKEEGHSKEPEQEANANHGEALTASQRGTKHYRRPCRQAEEKGQGGTRRELGGE